MKFRNPETGKCLRILLQPGLIFATKDAGNVPFPVGTMREKCGVISIVISTPKKLPT